MRKHSTTIINFIEKEHATKYIDAYILHISFHIHFHLSKLL